MMDDLSRLPYNNRVNNRHLRYRIARRRKAKDTPYSFFSA